MEGQDSQHLEVQLQANSHHKRRYSVNVTLDAVDPGVVTIDKKFIGVWKIDNEKENIHYTVRVQSHAVWVNDVECEIISCTQAEGATIKFGDDTLYLFDAAEDKEGKFVSAMIKSGDNKYVQFTLLGTNESVGIEIPEEYVGMYMTDDEKFKVVITYSSITINGVQYIPSSYSEADGFVGTYGSDTAYRVAFYSVAGTVNKDVLQIGNGDKLNRVESLNQNYIGTWESDPAITQYHYTVVFTETTLKINDKFYPVKYNQEYGYEVQFEGDGFSTYIRFFYNSFGNPSMIMYSNSGTTVNLYKKIPTKVPEEIIGTWEGMDGTTPITATIDKDGKLQIKIGDGEFVAINAEYDTDKNQFEFKLGDKTTFFEYRADTKTFNLYQVEGYNVDFTKSSNFTTPKAMQGTWTSDKGATVTIEKNKIVVTLETGESFTITEATVTVEPGVTHIAFTIGNDEYDIEYGTYGEKLFMQNLSKEMTFYYLTKVTG